MPEGKNSVQQQLRASYNKGYSLGYLDGYAKGREDALNGRTLSLAADDVLRRPIQDMNLSARTQNSLLRANCISIGDVASLEHRQICVIRNLGRVGAKEIAQALRGYGISSTAWDYYWEP